MTDAERIATLESAVRYLASRILGEGPQTDVVVMAAAENASPQQSLDPAVLATIGGALDRLEAERVVLAEQIADLSEQVRALAVRELTETAVLLASRAANDPESQRIFEEAAARAGRTPDEHRVASIRDYRNQTAKIMGAA